jgi:hypothetical protein
MASGPEAGEPGRWEAGCSLRRQSEHGLGVEQK